MWGTDLSSSDRVLASVVLVLLAALCAYGMVWLPGRLANAVLVLALGGLVVAPQVSLIPLYRLLDTLGLIDTHWAMILPYVAFRLPMAILLIRSVFVGISKDLVDAAIIDGCNSLQVFRHVYLPMSRTVLMTAAVLTAYFAWNEFLFAIVYVNSDAVRTIPAGLMSFRDALSTDWGVLGKKGKLADVLAEITGIDKDVLTCRQDIMDVSVAHCLSWAAQRSLVGQKIRHTA